MLQLNLFLNGSLHYFIMEKSALRQNWSFQRIHWSPYLFLPGSHKPLLIAAQMGGREAIMIKNMMGIQRAAGCLQISRTLVKGLIPHLLYDFFLRVAYLSVITGLSNVYIFTVVHIDCFSCLNSILYISVRQKYLIISKNPFPFNWRKFTLEECSKQIN